VLLLLALQLELARFLRHSSLVEAALLSSGLAGQQAEQAEDRWPVSTDDRQTLHGARHRHVQRVDVELVELQRLVALVLGAAIVELVALQVLG